MNGNFIQFVFPLSFSFPFLYNLLLFRVFIGGLWMIGIQTIRLIESNKNFKTIITALYCLDMMISGEHISRESWKGVNKEHVNILVHLIDFVSSLDDNDNQKYHNYIYQTVNCFIQNKRQINIDLDELNEDFVNSKIRDLIMHSLEKDYEK